MDIVRFLHSIGRQFPTALAMSPGIRQQDRIAVLQQQPSVTRHAFAIVSNSVEQDYRVAVVNPRVDIPTLEHRAIRGADADILQFSMEIVSHGGGNRLLVA